MIVEDPFDGRDRELTLEIRDVGRGYWKEKLALGDDSVKEEMLKQ